MAKKKKIYQMWGEYGALPMHRSNDLDELIARAKRLRLVTEHEYEIRNAFGETVWKTEKEKTLE